MFPPASLADWSLSQQVPPHFHAKNNRSRQFGGFPHPAALRRILEGLA
jgi:hypothetical protein